MRTKLCIYILIILGLGFFELQAQTNKLSETVTDIDGNVYNTVVIGTQTWLKEDLKTTRYRNGDTIGTTYPATLDISHESNPKYQWPYDGDESNVATYGRLYTWYAATDSRGICPCGWHVSTDAEWDTLTTFLGGYFPAQAKLKEAGTLHWNSPNDGTNESGFTALPGGNRWNDKFVGIGEFTHWWTATEYYGKIARRRMLENKGVRGNYRGASGKLVGWLVRCVKDPYVVSSVPNQLAFVNKEFSYIFPKSTFSGFKDTTLTYSAQLQNKEPLPDWITFNPKTQEFSGIPPSEQTLNISITAEDTSRNKCTDNFNILVVKHKTADMELCEDRKVLENSARFFDEENDFIELKNNEELRTKGLITVSCWIKPKSFVNRYNAWVSIEDMDKPYSKFRFGFGRELKKEREIISNNELKRSHGIRINRWSHIVFTLNITDSTLNFYLNGELVNTTCPKKQVVFSHSSLFIGNQTDDNCYFYGCVDDITIHNRILNPLEVFGLFREEDW